MRFVQVKKGQRVAACLGEGRAFVVLPDGGWIAKTTNAPRAKRSAAALDRQLAPVAAWVRPRTRVAIVVTDITRPFPERSVLPALMRRLQPASEVSIVVALGLHRPMSEDEKRAKYGRIDVIDHDPLTTVALGSIRGVPVRMNPVVAAADLVIATGVVEPHQYAGFSGGWKTVSIGCAGEETISATHGLRFLDDPRVAPGRLRQNPFQEIVRAIGRKTRLRFVINRVGETLLAGSPDEVLSRGAKLLRRTLSLPRSEPFDTIVAGVPAPKDASLYQASRAITYALCGPRPILRPGGTFVLFARGSEGAGRGAGEQRFLERFRSEGSPERVVESFRRQGVRGGEQRAYLVALAGLRARLCIAGCESPDEARVLGLEPVEEVEQVLRGRVLVLPNGLQWLP